MKNWKLIIRDINWKPLPPTEARRQLNNAVLYNYSDKTVPVELGEIIIITNHIFKLVFLLSLILTHFANSLSWLLWAFACKWLIFLFFSVDVTS